MIAADLGKASVNTVEYRPHNTKQFEADFGPAQAGFLEYLCNGFYTRCSADKYYDIAGPEPQSRYEITADLGRALVNTVEYRPHNTKQFEADFGAVRAGFSEYLCDGFYTRCSANKYYDITEPGRSPGT